MKKKLWRKQFQNHKWLKSKIKSSIFLLCKFLYEKKDPEIYFNLSYFLYNAMLYYIIKRNISQTIIVELYSYPTKSHYRLS